METRIDDIFAQALERESADRVAFLNEACGGDEQLRGRVEDMLRDAERADTFFGENNRKGYGQKSGDAIGPYILVKILGEGGFGEVWLAEQKRPISRTVALKIIKAGMDTREFLARFESERQALAMMDHPNIAKVLDAGATASGRPWFAMELVPGVPITRYCDEAVMGIPERLAIYTDLCSAIGHAHQKGIIHRDLKPSNVLVTVQAGKPVAKIIDFGIAKAIEGKLTDHTLVTHAEHFLGTPAYMSPEQASGLDLDTRSDIYSLGVLLYELLVGQPPFDSKTLLKSGPDEMRRIIREIEPVRPSTRIESASAGHKTRIATGQGIAPQKIKIAADLDWIVLKAMEKDRTRRYPTADELARDIAHFLANEPVSATPPSIGYLFGKFSRRHRMALQVVTIIAVLLVAATAVSTWLAVRARQAEKLASQRLRDSEAISQFLTEVFQSPDPQRAGRDVSVAEALDTAVVKLDTDLVDQPERRAKLLGILADTYTSLGLYAKGLETRRKAFEVLSQTFGDGNAETLATAHDLSEALVTSGYYEDAVKLNEKALALASKQNPESLQSATAMADLANAYLLTGRSDQARKTGEQALALSRQLNGPEAEATLDIMELLVDSYQRLNQVEKAKVMGKELIVLRTKLLGAIHPATVRIREMFEAPPVRTEEEREARLKKKIEEEEQALEKARAEHGPESIAAFEAMNALAYTYFCVPSKSTPLPNFEGHRADAINLQEKVLELARKIYGPTNKVTLDAMESLVFYNLRTNSRSDQIQAVRDELAELQIQVFGPESVEAARGMRRQASRASYLGDKEKANSLRREAVRIFSQTIGLRNRETANTRSGLATSLIRQGQVTEGLKILADCAPDMLDDTFVNGRLAALQACLDQTEEYEATRNWMIDWAVQKVPTLNSNRADMFDRVVRLSCLRPFTSPAQQEAVMAISRRSIEMRTKLGTTDDLIHHLALGMVQYRTGAYSESMTTMNRVAELAGNSKWDAPSYTGIARIYQAMALFQQGQKKRAQENFPAAVANADPMPAFGQPIPGSGDTDPIRLCMHLARREAQALIGSLDKTQP